MGPHVINGLVAAGFQVTVLTRAIKPGAYNTSIRVVEVDFTSVDSLTAALKGVDGLVSTVGSSALAGQTVLIDAAIAAGVKRFIPSEYGSCSTNPKLKDIPIYAPMFAIRQYLQEKEKANLTWTVLACGAFMEFLFGRPLLLDFEAHTATLYDNGDNRISSTSLPNVGNAIAAIFKNFEATKNSIVHTSEVILTQNRLLKIAERLRPEIKWEITKVDLSAMLKEGLEGVRAGDFSMPVIMKLLKATAFAGDVYGGAYDETDNALLGIKNLTAAELDSLVAGKLASK